MWTTLCAAGRLNTLLISAAVLSSGSCCQRQRRVRRVDVAPSGSVEGVGVRGRRQAHARASQTAQNISARERRTETWYRLIRQERAKAEIKARGKAKPQRKKLATPSSAPSQPAASKKRRVAFK